MLTSIASAGALVVFILIRIAIYLKRDWGDPVTRGTDLAIYGVPLLILVAVLFVFFRSAEIQVSNGVLTRRNWLGLSRRYRLDAIGGIALRDVITPMARRDSRYAIVYDRQRRCRFKMIRDLWDPADIERLRRLLGGDPSVSTVSKAELAAEFPGSLPWAVRHVVLVTIPATLGLILGLVLLDEALHHS